MATSDNNKNKPEDPEYTGFSGYEKPNFKLIHNSNYIKANLNYDLEPIEENLFKDNNILLFLFEDIYLFEFGYFLKISYGDKYKNDYQNLLNYLRPGLENADKTWDRIQPDLLNRDLTLAKHFKLINIIAPIFNKLEESEFNNYRNLYNIISTYFSQQYMNEILLSLFKNKILINPNNSSYFYNDHTKLYEFYENKYETINQLRIELKMYIQEITRLQKYVNSDVNETILKVFIKKITDIQELDDVLGKLKIDCKNKYVMNNDSVEEIAYQKDLVLCLKSGKTRQRTSNDYYTNAVFNAQYLPDYNQVPEYISELFHKDMIDSLQILLGMIISAEPEDYCIVFYGNGGNGKSVFLKQLKYMLGEFQKNIDYPNFIKQEPNDTIHKYNLNNLRVVELEDIESNFFKDGSKFKRMFNGRQFTIIATSNEKPDLEKKPLSMTRRLLFVKFNKIFVREPKKNNELARITKFKTNLDYLFTWIVKGAIKYFNGENFNMLFEFNEDIIKESDSIKYLIKNYLIRSENEKDRVSFQEMFNLYKTVCNENNFEELAFKKFNNKMRQEGFVSVMGHLHLTYWKNTLLKN